MLRKAATSGPDMTAEPTDEEKQAQGWHDLHVERRYRGTWAGCWSQCRQCRANNPWHGRAMILKLGDLTARVNELYTATRPHTGAADREGKRS